MKSVKFDQSTTLKARISRTESLNQAIFFNSFIARNKLAISVL
jgi:hypothetical protein